MVNQVIGNYRLGIFWCGQSWESFGVIGFDLGLFLQGQTRIAKMKSASVFCRVPRGFQCHTNL